MIAAQPMALLAATALQAETGGVRTRSSEGETEEFAPALEEMSSSDSAAGSGEQVEKARMGKDDNGCSVAAPDAAPGAESGASGGTETSSETDQTCAATLLTVETPENQVPDDMDPDAGESHESKPEKTADASDGSSRTVVPTDLVCTTEVTSGQEKAGELSGEAKAAGAVASSAAENASQSRQVSTAVHEDAAATTDDPPDGPSSATLTSRSPELDTLETMSRPEKPEVAPTRSASRNGADTRMKAAAPRTGESESSRDAESRPATDAQSRAPDRAVSGASHQVVQENAWLRAPVRRGMEFETRSVNDSGEAARTATAFQPASRTDSAATVAPRELHDAARTPLDESRLVGDILQHSRILTRPNGASEVRITLHPPELGAITLRLTMRDDRLRAEVQVEHPAIRPLIEGVRQRIGQALAGDGISLERFDVGLRGEGGSQSERHSGRPEPARSAAEAFVEEDETAQRASHGVSGRLDLVGVGSGTMDYFA